MAGTRAVGEHLIGRVYLPQRETRLTRCLPGARSEASRRERGGGFAGPSDDGGFDEVREFLRSNASNSATRRVNTSTRASRSASAASNRASRSSSSTVDGESDTPPRMHQTTHKIKDHIPRTC